MTSPPEQRLAKISSTAPTFSAALRGYRQAQAAGDGAIADGILALLAGQPNVAAAAKRSCGAKGDIDHFGAQSFLQGVLIVLRDSGHPGLMLVLDEVETIQRALSDVRGFVCIANRVTLAALQKCGRCNAQLTMASRRT